jgi:emp24/gp25L/p24 family/GOLD
MLAKGWIEKIRSKQDIEQGKRNWSIWTSHPELREDTFDVHIPKGSGGKYVLCFMSEHDEKVRQRLQQQRQMERREQLEREKRAIAESKGVHVEDHEQLKDAELLLDYEMEDDDEAYASEPVIVGFNVRVDPSDVVHAALTAGEQGPEGQRAIGLMTQIKAIERSWENLVDHFDFLRNREAYQISLTDQIQTRIVRWSVVEGIVVITMSIGQVLYWRKFFEQRRYL